MASRRTVSRTTLRGYETANQAYARRSAEVAKLLSDLQAGLKRHNGRQKSHEFDWGYPGDLAHAVEVLEPLKRFLK